MQIMDLSGRTRRRSGTFIFYLHSVDAVALRPKKALSFICTYHLNMLSDRYFKLLDIHTKWATVLWSCPFRWDKTRHELYITRTRWWRFAYSTFNLALVCLFLIARVSAQMLGLEVSSNTTFYLMCCTFIGSFLLFLLFFTMIWKSNELVKVVNDILRIFEFVQGTYMPTFNANTSHQNLLMDVILIIVGISLLTIALLVSLLAWIFPHWKLFLTSLFPVSFHSTLYGFSLYILQGVYTTWLVQMMYACLTILSDLILGIAPQVSTLLKEFICQRSGNGKPLRFQRANAEFRSWKNVTLLYRLIQLLNTDLLDIMSLMVIPLQTIISSLIIYCVVSLIKQWNQLDITVKIIFGIWATFCLVGWFVILSICATGYNVSQRALGSMRRREDWGRERDRKFMLKFLKSCKPLSIGYGKAYVIRKVSILNFFKFLTRGTARALLTLQ